MRDQPRLQDGRPAHLLHQPYAHQYEQAEDHQSQVNFLHCIAKNAAFSNHGIDWIRPIYINIYFIHIYKFGQSILMTEKFWILVSRLSLNLDPTLWTRLIRNRAFSKRPNPNRNKLPEFKISYLSQKRLKYNNVNDFHCTFYYILSQS